MTEEQWLKDHYTPYSTNKYVEFGTAVHEAIEGKCQITPNGHYLWRNKRFDPTTAESSPNIVVHWEFVLAAKDKENPATEPMRNVINWERSASRDILTRFGTVELKGRADGITVDNQAVEIKTTSEYNEANYADTWQSKCYFYLFDVPQLHYFILEWKYKQFQGKKYPRLVALHTQNAKRKSDNYYVLRDVVNKYLEFKKRMTGEL